MRNTGVAFGLFRGHESLLFLLITVSLIVLILWGCFVKHEDKRVHMVIALILGGAIGNWIDRVRFGAVIDFFDFRVWPVFNIADSAISIGVFLYLLFLFDRKKAKENS